MFSYTGPTAPSHHELMNIYKAAFEARLAAGDIRRLVVPQFGFGLAILLTYLCIPHTNRPWLYAARLPVLGLIVALEVKTMSEVRSMTLGFGFGAGLVSAWGIIWSMTWLLWNDPQFDAKRVQRRKERGLIALKAGVSEANGHVSNENASKTDGEQRQRQSQNRHTKTWELDKGLKQNGGTADSEYYWQSYPMDSLRDRIDWVFDLIFNFRGPGWSWEVPSNPAIPAQIRVRLGEPVDLKSMRDTSSTGVRRFSSRSELFRAQFPRLIIGYLLLDAIKVVAMKDPYFLLGPNDYPLPKYLSSLSPLLLTAYRQLLTMLSIIIAIETIFCLPQFAFCILLGPRILGLRGEPWMYPTTWGSLDNVFTNGLKGLWGGWWHQTFRYAFSAPTNCLIRHKIITRKSQAAKIISLTVAFATSGLLHASGSITQFPTTKPSHQLLFFMLQVAGILLQSSFCHFFQPWTAKLPVEMRRAANFAYTFGWLYCTSPLLVDDFARGGLWLFQPVPLSPLRGLGFGDVGDGWWCWEGMGIAWYTGRHWWESGLAF